MLKGKTLVVDNPHGGKDPGAVDGIDLSHGDTIRTLEKVPGFRIAKRVNSFLNQLGAISFLTNENDATMTPNQRVRFASRKKADAFVSIHLNFATNPAAEGIETLYYHQGSYKLAEMVHNELIRTLKCKDRGIKYRDNLGVLKQPRPAILTEVGFISNVAEEKLLATDSHQLKIAQAITRGIAKYFA